MPAISKAWVSIADGAVDPDSPVDATLMTGIRDDLVHLREWIGASFFAGAVQDHNHDGSNSALIQVGPNLLRNGSFEDGEAGWAITDFSGGSHAISTATRHHGAKSLAITSTVLANGGGNALSGEFMLVGGGEGYGWSAQISASTGNMSGRVSIVWYDAAQSQISEVNLYDSVALPTARLEISGPVTAPATARFAKLRVTGGVPAAGSATGTVFFDGVFFNRSIGGPIEIIPATSFPAASAVTLSNVPQGFRALLLTIDQASSNTATRAPTVRFNNDSTAANYQGSYHTPTVGINANNLPSFQHPQTQAAAEVSSSVIMLMGYQAGTPTIALAAGNSQSAAVQFFTAVRHNSLSAMTEITITWDGSGNFDGGTYSLHGVM